MPAWLVGGAVRDALLDRPTRDIDVVVEGDAAAAAARLVRVLGGTLTVHPAFGTAAVRLEHAVVDVVTARAEHYASPGRLPVVRPADLEADLRRRDFTANAMAVALTADGLGTLVDPLGGCDDLRAGRLRVLHPASFRDDATRILRGVRYGARLDLHWEASTERLARAAVADGLPASVGPDRLREELLLVLDEPTATAALAALDGLGALAVLLPGVRLDESIRAALDRVEPLAARHEPTARRAPLRLGLLLGSVPASARPAAVAALGLRRTDARIAAAAAAAADLADGLAGDRRPDAAAEVLGRLPVEAALAVAARGDHRAAARAVDWLDRLRHVHLEVDGDDLQRVLGLRPSPELGALLAELRRRKLRGDLPDRASELEAARSLVGGVRPQARP